MRSTAEKNEKNYAHFNFCENPSNYKIHEIYKGKLGGQVLKRPTFGLWCTNFAQIFFKVTLLQSMKSQTLSKYLKHLKKIVIAC